MWTVAGPSAAGTLRRAWSIVMPVNSSVPAVASSPTDTAIRGTHLYITDGGDAAPHDAKLQEARIDLAALFDAGPASQ
jgi:hypothetical protein